MIARGDLAVEVGFARLSEMQEEILWLCEAAHVPVIWATQVLDQLVLYRRFTLSYRDVEDLLAERGLMVSNELIRRWVLKFGPIIARNLRETRAKAHGRSASR